MYAIYVLFHLYDASFKFSSPCSILKINTKKSAREIHTIFLRLLELFNTPHAFFLLFFCLYNAAPALKWPETNSWQPTKIRTVVPHVFQDIKPSIKDGRYIPASWTGRFWLSSLHVFPLFLSLNFLPTATETSHIAAIWSSCVCPCGPCAHAHIHENELYKEATLFRKLSTLHMF